MADVLLEKRPDGVALVTLNRPETLNAMGGTLMADLAEALTDCEADPSIRCLALTGAGRGFCSGGDIGMFQERLESGSSGFVGPAAALPRRVAALRDLQRRSSLRLHRMPKPTVALVNGPAAGAGMSLALACDLRLLSERAVLVPGFGRLAFSGDFGGSWFLTKLLGFGRARELYYLGEPVDASRALALGIANRVYPADEFESAGLEFCARLAAGSPLALARMKENLLRAEGATLEEALDQEALNMYLSALTDDHREGVQAFVEKRPPRFTGK